MLDLYCEMIDIRGAVGFGKVVAKVGDKIAAQGEISFVIT